MTPPDPMSLRPARTARAAVGRPAVPEDALSRPRQPGAAADDERGRLPRSVVRDRRAEGDDERLGHHRHLPRRALARHRLRAAAPLHGRDRRRLPLLGAVARRHRRGVERDRRRRPAASAPRSAPRRRSPASCTRAGQATGVVLENGDEIAADVVVSSVDPRLTFERFLEPRSCPTSSSPACGATSTAARRAR